MTAYNESRDENSYTVVTTGGAEVTLDGLTITAGQGGNPADNDNGAGLYTETTANGATLTNCTFTNNTTAGHGAGAYFGAAATLTNCTFTDNTVEGYGGGAYFGAANTMEVTTLTACTFTGNVAEFGGGAIFYINVMLTDCTFTNNETTDSGGGAYFDFNAVTTLRACTFTGNMSTLTYGGGAYCAGSTTLENCVVAGNRAATVGGGMVFTRRSTVINSTFYNNTATERGGGILFNSRNTKNTANPLFEPFNLQNSILLDNTATTAGNAIYFAHSPTSSVTDIDATMDHNLIGEEVADIGAGSLGSGLTGTYTDLPFTDATNATLTNTIEESPAAEVFASITASEANYLRLAAASPAANAGNNDYLNNGTPDNTEDDLTTDLAGDARIQAGTVDLGAYESDIKVAQDITFTLAASAPAGDHIPLAATSSAGLPVSYVSSAPAVAEVVDNDGTSTLRLVGAGMATITASQSGDDTYTAAMDVMQTIEVITPTIRRVVVSSTATTQDGTTWENAMTLQAALASTFVPGDQLWIAAGTYKPHANRPNGHLHHP